MLLQMQLLRPDFLLSLHLLHQRLHPLLYRFHAAKVLISEIFPRITSNFNFLHQVDSCIRSKMNLLLLQPDQAEPYDSNSFAFFPAANIPSIRSYIQCSNIDIQSLRKLHVISSTSCGSSDMIGLPPHAKNHICYIIDRYIICNIMDKRSFSL